jgi:23S rRNA pseudouridine2604 synthase
VNSSKTPDSSEQASERPGDRLAKRVAQMKSISRREAEEIIEAGFVKVDGKVIEEPQFKVLEQKIDIDANAKPGQVEPVTILLHKPAGYEAGRDAPLPMALITTASRSPGDRSGIRMINRHFAKQTLMLPLEKEASGLVVMTQDFRVERKLREDASKVEQEFVVEVKFAAGGPSPATKAADDDADEPESDAMTELRASILNRLNRGIAYKERLPAYLKASWQNETRLRFAIKDARPGQITFMCEAVGLKVVSMKRIRIGRIPMAGMQVGQWRYLGKEEKF